MPRQRGDQIGSWEALPIQSRVLQRMRRLRRRVPLRGDQDGTRNDLMAVDRRQRDLGDDPIKVALFIPCYVDAVYPEVRVATTADAVTGPMPGMLCRRRTVSSDLPICSSSRS